MKKLAITRLVVLLIVAINQSLIVFGLNPLPFSEEQIFEGVSAAATVLVSVWAWWKNNNVTPQAIEAQKIMEDMKSVKEV